MLFKSCLTFFLDWNLKGDVEQNVLAAVFPTMKVNGDHLIRQERFFCCCFCFFG